MILKVPVCFLLRSCLLTTLLFILFSTYAHSQSKPERPNYKLLWKISGKGLARPSYLFGTMHVHDNKAFDFSDSVLLNLLACDAFAMEVHPDSVMTAMVKLIFNNSENKKNKFREIFDDKDYRELDSLVKLKSGYSLEKLKTPSMAEYMLEKNDKKNRDKNTFLDAYLYGIAKSHKKQIVGLEDAEDQLSIMDNLSPKEIKKIIFSYLKSDSVKTPDYSDSYNQLLSIYYSGDIDRIYELMRSTYKFSKEYYDKLITIRNEGMVKSIIESISEKSTFVAVGAAHLPGHEGIIQLLQKEGYQVTKVTSPFSGLADKYKYKTEETTWNNYTFTKGAYSIKMPTSPIPIKMDSVGITLEMSLDLASGAIYQSTHLPLNNSFEGKDAKYVLHKFEESFRKKSKYLLEKSIKIEVNGLPGREFWTQDNEDFFKARLILRNNILYLLMVGPTKEHAGSSEGKIFLNSFKTIDFVNETWKEYSHTKGAFKIDHWGPPEVKLVDYEDPDGSGTYHLNIFSTSNNTSGESFLIRYNDFPPGRVSYNDSVYYATLIEDFYNNLGGSELSIENVVIEKLKGRSFTFKIGDEGLVKGRAVLRGNRSYFLLTTSSIKNDSKNTDHFLQSFKLSPFDTTLFKEYSLEGANVKVKLPAKPRVDEEDKDLNKNFLSNGVIYNSIDGKTGISYIVIHRKAGRYSNYKNSEDFFKRVKNDYLEKSDSIVDSSFYYSDVFISKTYTTFPRIINSYKKIKITQSGENVYVLLSYIPKDYLTNPVVKDFFNSISIQETSGKNIFTGSSDLLFEDLVSSDTSISREAKEALEYYTFDDSDCESIYKALSRNYDDDIEEGGIRSMLLDILSGIKSDTKEDFIKKLFPVLPEKGKLRTKALVVLSSLKTKKSSLALLQLLKENSIDASDYQSASVFYPYLDTLSLVPHLFPGVLDQLNQEGFQDILFQLAKHGLDSALFTKEIEKEINIKMDRFFATLLDTEIRISQEDDQYYDLLSKFENLILLIGKLEFNQTISGVLNKVIDTREPSLMLSVVKVLVLNKQNVSSKTLEIIAANSLTRVQLYQFLKERNLQQNFPDEYYTKKAFAESNLVEYLNYDEGIPNMIEFLTVKKVLYKGKNKELYVFKFKYAEEDEWYLGISGPFEKSKVIEYDTDLTYSFLDPYDKKTLNKDLERMLNGAEANLVR